MRITALAGLCLGFALLTGGPGGVTAQEKDEPKDEKKEPGKEPEKELIPAPKPKPKPARKPVVLKPAGDLVKQLHEKDAKVRQAAAVELVKHDVDAKAETPALLGLLKDPDDYTRLLAAYVLAYCRPDPEAVLPPLLGALKDKNAGVRRMAAAAIIKQGKEAQKLTPQLLALLKDPDGDVRMMGVYTLGGIMADPREVGFALNEAARNDPAEPVRKAAQEALKRIESKPGAAAEKP